MDGRRRYPDEALSLERDIGKLDYGLLSVSIPSHPSLKIVRPRPLVVRSSTVKLISEDERSDAVDPGADSPFSLATSSSSSACSSSHRCNMT